MASFNRVDYRYLFVLGKELYTGKITAKQAGARLMAMSEYAIGQQADWPSIHAKHRHLTAYREQPPKEGNVTDIKDHRK